MLELLAIWYFGARLAGVASAKGRGRKWGFLVLVAWLVGEIIGFVVAGALGFQLLASYALAISLALGLVAICFSVVRALPSTVE